MNINKLSKEVDVYCAWIDDAEAKNKNIRGGGGVAGLGFTSANASRRLNAEDDYDSEDVEGGADNVADNDSDEDNIQTKSRMMPTGGRSNNLQKSNRFNDYDDDNEERKSEDEDDIDRR